MGLFDALKGDEAISLTSHAAVLLGCITMIAADGDIDEDELAIVRRIDGPHETPHWEAAVRTWKRHELHACVDAVCGAIQAEHVLPLFANLIDIAMADGALAGAEKALLETYMARLTPDEVDIASMVEVIGVKNALNTRAG